MCYITCSGLGENSLARRDNFSISVLTGRGEGSLSFWPLKCCPHHCHSAHSNWNTSAFKLTEQLLPLSWGFLSTVLLILLPGERLSRWGNPSFQTSGERVSQPRKGGTLPMVSFSCVLSSEWPCRTRSPAWWGRAGQRRWVQFPWQWVPEASVARQAAGSLPLHTGSTALLLAAVLFAPVSSWSFRISFVAAFMSLVSVWENYKFWAYKKCDFVSEQRNGRSSEYKGGKVLGDGPLWKGGWNSEVRPTLRPEFPVKCRGRTHSMAGRVLPKGPRDPPPRCHWHTGC